MATNIQIWAYEFLAAPAHLWLWVCARLVGGRFTCWRETTDDDTKRRAEKA